MVMPKGSRAQAASPVLLHSDLDMMASTPLFDDHDDTLEVVLFDTTVEYMPKSKTRTRTALNTDAHIESLKKQLLESSEQLVPVEGLFQADSAGSFGPPGLMALDHNCYQMNVELESPSEGQTTTPPCDYLLPGRLEEDSSLVSVFRALKCIEVEDAPQDSRLLSLEVRRPQHPRQISGLRHPSGYSPLSQDVTIDY
ncbi:uncharacterized protein LOC121854375 [Homarus americanus]|uniref:Uncharacterized protein n=1 Tax=Homarus americanus TaxID=6706 RepID=A0A8J5JDF1_HOMAM|nr:uncharacterized protein LOC121854375 [Homarus americanus]KAG7155865.1 hypothetical protein Hamer_G011997 [Homarus americanus]